MAPQTIIATRNLLSTIADTAQKAQTSLYEIDYLVEAIDKAADDVVAADGNDAKLRAIDMVMVFCRLARAPIAEAKNHGQRIEEIALRFDPNGLPSEGEA